MNRFQQWVATQDTRPFGSSVTDAIRIREARRCYRAFMAIGLSRAAQWRAKGEKDNCRGMIGNARSHRHALDGL